MVFDNNISALFDDETPKRTDNPFRVSDYYDDIDSDIQDLRTMSGGRLNIIKLLKKLFGSDLVKKSGKALIDVLLPAIRKKGIIGEKIGDVYDIGKDIYEKVKAKKIKNIGDIIDIGKEYTKGSGILPAERLKEEFLKKFGKGLNVGGGLRIAGGKKLFVRDIESLGKSLGTLFKPRKFLKHTFVPHLIDEISKLSPLVRQLTQPKMRKVMYNVDKVLKRKKHQGSGLGLGAILGLISMLPVGIDLATTVIPLIKNLFIKKKGQMGSGIQDKLLKRLGKDIAKAMIMKQNGSGIGDIVKFIAKSGKAIYKLIKKAMPTIKRIGKPMIKALYPIAKKGVEKLLKKKEKNFREEELKKMLKIQQESADKMREQLLREQKERISNTGNFDKLLRNKKYI